MKTNLKIKKSSKHVAGIATTADGRFICVVTRKNERYYNCSKSGMTEVRYEDVDFEHMYELDSIFLNSQNWQAILHMWGRN